MHGRGADDLERSHNNNSKTLWLTQLLNAISIFTFDNTINSCTNLCLQVHVQFTKVLVSMPNCCTQITETIQEVLTFNFKIKYYHKIEQIQGNVLTNATKHKETTIHEHF